MSTPCKVCVIVRVKLVCVLLSTFYFVDLEVDPGKLTLDFTPCFGTPGGPLSVNLRKFDTIQCLHPGVTLDYLHPMIMSSKEFSLLILS